MVYVDTSALVPLFLTEESTASIHDWMETQRKALVISEWSMVEFASALSIRVRQGHTDARTATRARDRMRRFAEEQCTVVIPTLGDFRRATELCRAASASIRGGDALHLAIAETVRAEAILCFDGVMAKGARAIGIPVVAL